MSRPDKEAEHWGEVARGWSEKGYANQLLGEEKKKTYLDLITRWTKITPGQRILKTDLFAEAFGVEQFFFDIIPAKSDVVAIDVSIEIVAQARSRAQSLGLEAGGPEGRVRVFAEAAGERVAFLVEDEGRLDDSSEPSELCGRPLTHEIARVLLARLGGSFEVSRPEGRTRVAFAFPIARG